MRVICLFLLGFFSIQTVSSAWAVAEPTAVAQASSPADTASESKKSSESTSKFKKLLKWPNYMWGGFATIGAVAGLVWLRGITRSPVKPVVQADDGQQAPKPENQPKDGKQEMVVPPQLPAPNSNNAPQTDVAAVAVNLGKEPKLEPVLKEDILKTYLNKADAFGDYKKPYESAITLMTANPPILNNNLWADSLGTFDSLLLGRIKTNMFSTIPNILLSHTKVIDTINECAGKISFKFPKEATYVPSIKGYYPASYFWASLKGDTIKEIVETVTPDINNGWFGHAPSIYSLDDLVEQEYQEDTAKLDLVSLKAINRKMVGLLIESMDSKKSNLKEKVIPLHWSLDHHEQFREKFGKQKWYEVLVSPVLVNERKSHPQEVIQMHIGTIWDSMRKSSQDYLTEAYQQDKDPVLDLKAFKIKYDTLLKPYADFTTIMGDELSQYGITFPPSNSSGSLTFAVEKTDHFQYSYLKSKPQVQPAQPQIMDK